MRPKLDFQEMLHQLDNTSKSSHKGFTLLKVIIKTYKSFLTSIGILALLTTIITMMAPALTHKIISFVKLGEIDRQTSEGAWLVILILVVTLGKAIVQTHLYYQFAVFGFNLSNTISLVLYQKALKYPSLSSHKYTLS
jgi:ABC-type multidrug transport system fused ATPase/permease subunit